MCNFLGSRLEWAAGEHDEGKVGGRVSVVPGFLPGCRCRCCRWPGRKPGLAVVSVRVPPRGEQKQRGELPFWGQRVAVENRDVDEPGAFEGLWEEADSTDWAWRGTKVANQMARMASAMRRVRTWNLEAASMLGSPLEKMICNCKQTIAATRRRSLEDRLRIRAGKVEEPFG